MEKITSICADRDWVNRKCNFVNNEFIAPYFSERNNLSFEAYQSSFYKAFDVYVTDNGHFDQIWGNDYDAIQAIHKERNSIYLLTHERSFHRNLFAVWESNFTVLTEKSDTETCLVCGEIRLQCISVCLCL